MYATPMPSFNRSDRKSTRLNSSHSLHDALPISLTAFASSRHGGGMSILTAVGRYIDAWNVRDANAIVQSFHSDGTYEDPVTAKPIAGSAIAEYAQSLWSAFPDLHLDRKSTRLNSSH